MMKKLFAVLLCALFITPSFGAALRIVDAPAFEAILQKHFPNDKNAQARIAGYYRDTMAKRENDSRNAVQQGTDLCKAGAIHNDKARCTAFISDVLWKASGQYYAPCGNYWNPPAEINATTKCFRGFSGYDKNSINANVQVASAAALAKEYARVVWGDNIVCGGPTRTEGNDDFIRCKSIDQHKYYEFEFDDVRESFDDDVHSSIIKGIAYIYHQKGIDIPFGTVSQADCNQVKQTADVFGITTKYEGGKCNLKWDVINSRSQLKTACGIDNFEFCAGSDIQINTNYATEKYMAMHVAEKCGVDQSQVTCDKGFKTYYGSGCNVQKGQWIQRKDDVVTCHYNGQQIDFVFDDVNEAFKYVAEGGQQGMMCITSGGIFDSKNCSLVGKESCDALRLMNIDDCPECRDVVWDESSQMCILKSAKFATNVNKATKIGAVAGAAIVAVVATVFSGGTAAPGAWAIVSATANALVIGGATAQVTAEAVMTYGIMEPFVEKANKCYNSGDVACVAKLVEEEINRMQSYSKELSPQEAKAVDQIFVKFLGMIPDDDPFWTEFWGDPDFFDCPNPDDPTTCVVKESEQGWQKLRKYGNYAMIAGGIMKMGAQLLGRQSALQNATRARVVNNMNNRSNLAKVVNPGGSNGSLVSNEFIKNTVKIPGVTTNSQLVTYLKLKPGDVFWLTDTGQVIRNVSTARNLLGLVPIVVGEGNQLYHAKDDPNFAYHKGQGSTVPPTGGDTGDGTGGETGGKTGGRTGGGTGGRTGGGTGGGRQPNIPDLVWDWDIEIEDPELEIEDVVIDISDDDLHVEKIPLKNRDIKPHAIKDPLKTGLIATAAVLGAVGTGVLVGGLVSNNKDDDKLSSLPSSTTSALEKDLETVLNNTNGFLGMVDGNMIKLVPMKTTDNTDAKIININGNAVVVVDYRGHNIPFFANDNTGSWVPLLGIGVNGGWFNTYPASGAPAFVVQIQNLLNQKLAPSTVAQFVGANALGVQFPAPAYDAYTVINAEFPNGVVQTYTVPMSSADQTLYNNNYNRIKNLFNTAQLGGFF